MSRCPPLIEQLREALRARHYSPRTVDAYGAWARRFAAFLGHRDPRGLPPSEVARFLTSLAGTGVSASTQNQALGALLFFYQYVLQVAVPDLHDIVARVVRSGCRSCCRVPRCRSCCRA